MFGSGVGASAFLRLQSESLLLPEDCTASRPPIPLSYQLTPYWPRVPPSVRAAATAQQEMLDKGIQGLLSSVSDSVSSFLSAL